MTEAEWLTCPDPEAMVAFLQGKASDRKLRLFACACCRRIWSFLPHQRCRHAVKCAELYADALLSTDERQEAIRRSTETYVELGAIADALLQGTWTALDSLSSDTERETYERMYAQAYARARNLRADANQAWEAAQAALAAYRALVDAPDVRWASLNAARVLTYACTPVIQKVCTHGGDANELAAQSALLRDIFGNPFRPVACDPAWRTPEVVTLARSIYDERRFEEMPRLADVLEKAGCHDQDILMHCRGQGVHVKGCWVADLLLGKD